MPKQIKRLLTLDDLVKFCASYGLQKFSANESGYRLSVQIPAPATFDEVQPDSQLLYVTVKMFHTGKNRNGSFISDETAKKSLGGIKYKPLLANFCEIDGVKDFTSHDMQIVRDDDDDYKIEYLEHQIGCFTADEPYMVYDIVNDRSYVYAKAAIPREYTDAAEIIERKHGTKVSVELSINEMSYSVEKGAFVFDDFEVMGCTCLGVNPDTGEEIKEGMEGARLTIEDFSEENNSIMNKVEKDMNNAKGGEGTLNKFDELLEKYGVTAEDVTFTYEGLSDEELEQAFEDAFFVKPTDDDDDDSTPVADDGDDKEEEDKDKPSTKGGLKAAPATTDEPTEEDNTDNNEENGEDGVSNEDTSSVFALTLSEIESAVWRVVNETYALVDGDGVKYYAYSCDVYDDYVVMHNYEDGKFYKQSYEMNDDTVVLEGERVEVFPEYLTAEERGALELMRSTYDELKEYKENTEKTILDNQKQDVFDMFDEKLNNNEEYASLKANKDNYSVEDITLRCNALIGAETMKFAQKDGQKKKSSIGLDFTHKPVKKPYGNLFD